MSPRFRIRVGDQVEKIIPLGAPIEVPVGSTPGPADEPDLESPLAPVADPDIVIQLNTGLAGTQMRCSLCEATYSEGDLEQQIVKHLMRRFSGYRVDEALADAINDELEPWLARIKAGERVCFGCTVISNGSLAVAVRRNATASAEEIAQNALGCLEPDDPGCIVAAIEGVFLPQVIARASIKLEAIRILLDTHAAATGESAAGAGCGPAT